MYRHRGRGRGRAVVRPPQQRRDDPGSRGAREVAFQATDRAGRDDLRRANPEPSEQADNQNPGEAQDEGSVTEPLQSISTEQDLDERQSRHSSFSRTATALEISPPKQRTVSATSKSFPQTVRSASAPLANDFGSNEVNFAELPRPERLRLLVATARHGAERTFERRRGSADHSLRSESSVSDLAGNAFLPTALDNEAFTEHLHGLNSLDSLLKKRNLEALSLVHNSNVLRSTFTNSEHTNELPRFISSSGIVHKDPPLPPPRGVDNSSPQRSLADTHIHASHIVLAEDQENKDGSEETTPLDVMYYIGAPPAPATVSLRPTAQAFVPLHLSLASATRLQENRSSQRDQNLLRVACLPSDTESNPQVNITWPIIPWNQESSIPSISCLRNTSTAALPQPAFATELQRESSSQQDKARLPSEGSRSEYILLPFPLQRSRPAAPVFFGSTAETREIMAAPLSPSKHLARARLALETARQTLGLTPQQLLAFLATPVPAIDHYIAENVRNETQSEAHARIKHEADKIKDIFKKPHPPRLFTAYPSPNDPIWHHRRRAVPSTVADDVGFAGNPTNVWSAADFSGFRMIPTELKLPAEPLDINTLVKEAGLSSLMYPARSRNMNYQNEEETGSATKSKHTKDRSPTRGPGSPRRRGASRPIRRRTYNMHRQKKSQYIFHPQAPIFTPRLLPPYSSSMLSPLTPAFVPRSSAQAQNQDRE